ncbi:hypothetical protein BT63DRAFT_426248 [Microthyrium microscopicum]|uniref:Uncharacterized protein n=1 Tax=Microthyrium microscopicum TaxID=703497 RepID=A0A6A6U5D0_9PEZI|nr:hypothetical protein BT63DRAFT_426248 [Microthyrium microscopicum]
MTQSIQEQINADAQRKVNTNADRSESSSLAEGWQYYNFGILHLCLVMVIFAGSARQENFIHL